jgi:uncharacterized phage protein (TIGR02218 family)
MGTVPYPGTLGYLQWVGVSCTGWHEPWNYPTNFYNLIISGTYPEWVFRKSVWITQGAELYDAVLAEDCDRIAAGTWTFLLWLSCSVSNLADRHIRIEVYLRNGETDTLLFVETTINLKGYNYSNPLITTVEHSAVTIAAGSRLIVKMFYEKAEAPWPDGNNQIKMGYQMPGYVWHSYVEFPCDLAPEPLPLATGWKIGNVEIRDNGFTAELRSRSQHLQQQVLELYTPMCRAKLGDSRCGIDLEDSGDTYRHTGSVTSVTEDRRKFIDTSVTGITEDVFRYGLLTWSDPESSGESDHNNAGFAMEVKKYSPDTKEFELFEAMPYEIEVGDGFTVTWGCDKSTITCRDRFDNIVNFRGEPFVPGSDAVIKTYW